MKKLAAFLLAVTLFSPVFADTPTTPQKDAPAAKNAPKSDSDKDTPKGETMKDAPKADSKKAVPKADSKKAPKKDTNKDGKDPDKK